MITKEELDQIVELVDYVPEQYREKCFEILLRFSLGGKQKLPTFEQLNESTEIDFDGEKELADSVNEIIVPIDVKAFLSQYDLTEDVLWKLFLVEGEDIRPIYRLKTNKKSEVQNQHALMMSLEHAIKDGNFEVLIDDLRDRCKELKSYDKSNFSANYKNNHKLYKKVQDVESLELSPDGKSELADLIESLTSGNG